MTYDEFFQSVIGRPDTGAVTGAWLYRRLTGDDATPRRLVGCLPMRVLVEQTGDAVAAWLETMARLVDWRASRSTLEQSYKQFRNGEHNG